MDEHKWKVNGRDALADRHGIKYERDAGEEPVYIIGGGIANEEILRLAEEVERLRAEREQAFYLPVPGEERARIRREMLEEVERLTTTSYVEGHHCAPILVRKVSTDDILEAVDRICSE